MKDKEPQLAVTFRVIRNKNYIHTDTETIAVYIVVPIGLKQWVKTKPAAGYFFRLIF